MQLFYNPDLNTDTQKVVFDKKESRHIIKVLRKVIGDKLHITNGKGVLYSAYIIDDNSNKCIAKVKSISHEEPLSYKLHIAVAPTKRNERMEWFLEKATEIGIAEITPIICEHSERKKVNLNRYERVLQSAMKQSLQTYLPKLNDAMTFSAFINQSRDRQRYIAHCEEDKKEQLFSALNPNETTTILIGPEGDFSPSEIESALTNGFLPVSLGDHRLRTETAALVACHTVALFNQK